MFKKEYKKYNEAERAYWAQAKARGKRRFILREMVVNTTLWLGITAVVGFADRSHSSSVWLVGSTALIMLPLVWLGGYLSGKWKWSDFEKKYREWFSVGDDPGTRR